MLMRRARAHNSSCSQVVLVYVHPFRSSSLFCSRKLQKNTKSFYFGGLRSFKVIDVILLKSRSLVLFMISSMSVPICNHFHAGQANIGKIAILGGTSF